MKPEKLIDSATDMGRAAGVGVPLVPDLENQKVVPGQTAGRWPRESESGEDSNAQGVTEIVYLRRDEEHPWRLDTTGKLLQTDSELVALYDLIYMYEAAYPLNTPVAVTATAQDLRDDATRRQEWFKLHERDFLRITDETAEQVYDKLLQDARQSTKDIVTPVWTNQGLHYPVRIIINPEWRLINQLWYPDPVELLDNCKKQPARRYRYGPKYHDLSCAYDCALWVAVQLDVWRRRADEYTSMQQPPTPEALVLRSMVRHHWGSSLEEALRDRMRDVLRNMIQKTPENEVTSITSVLDATLGGLPQMTWLSLQGVGGDSGLVESARRVTPVSHIDLDVGGKEERQSIDLGNALSLKFSSPPQVEGATGGDIRMVAGEAPYVLQVRPVAGWSPVVWKEFLELCGGLKGVTEVHVNLMAVHDGEVKRLVRTYNLVGVVSLDVKRGRTNHFVAYWWRKVYGFRYDGHKSGKVRGWLEGGRNPEMNIVCLFYEVDVGGVQASG